MHGVVIANLLIVAMNLIGISLNIKPPPWKAYAAGWVALAVILAFVIP